MSEEVTKQQLLSFVERLEQLESAREDVSNTIKDVYDEMKDQGFDVKTVRKIIKLRKMRAEDIEREQALLDLYMEAIGL